MSSRPDAHPRRGRGPRLVAAAAVLQLLASLAGAAVLHDRHRPERPPAAAPSPSSAVQAAPAADPVLERERAVRRLLDARADALLRRDREAFLATVLPSATAFRERQAALFDALAEVPLASWSYELDGVRGRDGSAELDARHGGGAWWSPDVVLRYAIAEFDPEPTYAPQRLTFARAGGGWYLAADDDFEAVGQPSTRGLWDFGPVVAVRGVHTLALGHPSSSDLMRQVVAVVDTAVPRVSQVWGTDWSQSVVVLVPETQVELDRMLNGSTDLSRIAAVATAEITDADGAYLPVGNRVIVNPPNFAKLGRLGRQVVLTHETVHVATRAATGPDMPTWLVEGLADHVGYLDVPVGVATAARELREAVRAGRVPERLPTAADFDGGNPDLAQAYEGSWLAFRMLVEQNGSDRALAFYRAVGASRGAGSDAAVERALAAELGTSTAALTAAWRDYLVRTLS